MIRIGDVEVIYCPTDEMIAHYNTKALVVAKITQFRELIMNLLGIPHLIVQQERVGKQIYIQMKLPSNGGIQVIQFTKARTSTEEIAAGRKNKRNKLTLWFEDQTTNDTDNKL